MLSWVLLVLCGVIFVTQLGHLIMDIQDRGRKRRGK